MAGHKVVRYKQQSILLCKNPVFGSDGFHAGGYGLRGETTGGLGHQCFSGQAEEYWAFNTTVTRLFLVDPDGTEA